MKFKKELSYYRNNKTGTGFAASFKLSQIMKDDEHVETAVFLSMAPQVLGERSFAWQDKAIVVKFNEADVAQFLSVINRGQTSAGGERGLYHESPKGGFKSVEFKVKEDGAGFYLKVSGQDPNKKPLGNYSIVLSPGDAELMRALFTRAIETMYEW